MPLRVCILARESLLTWAAYYVSAFREVCDVISIGPDTNAAAHDFPDWSRVEHYLVRNDIVSDEQDAPALLALLPDGWLPDLVVAIQSGSQVISGISQLGCPTAYLSIDTWHDPREFVLGHQYDFIFLAQKGIVKYMRKMGCCRAFWLPLACDPRAHYAMPGDESFDIAFIGSTHFMVNRQRVRRLKMLEEHFSLGYNFGLGCDEMAEAYGRAKLIFNASIACDVNMRVFEALATGKPLVTNREAESNGLFDLFEDDRHLVTYTDENLIRQVRRCLDNPEWARTVGEAGRREVLEKHTYVHRARAVLDTVADYVPDFGHRANKPLKTGLRVGEFVPYGTRRLLDFGMGLDTSRVALRHLGVHYVAAVAPNAEAMQQRGRSYDTVLLQAPDLHVDPAEFDAVLWNRPLALGLTLDYVFDASTAWMVEGGRVLLILEERELGYLAGELSFSEIRKWLSPKGYKLLVWRRGSVDSNYHLLVACQCTCTHEEVVAQLYREFPVNGEDTNPGVRIFSEEAPGLSDAGHP